MVRDDELRTRPCRGVETFRVDAAEFLSLPLEVHHLLHDVPLRDVSAIDLPGGGTARTIADVQRLVTEENLTAANLVVRALFGLRRVLGGVFGWDREGSSPGSRMLSQHLPDDLRGRSLVPPGTSEGPFTIAYELEAETLSEIRNATVHAFLCRALIAREHGYRLYWAVYVQPVSWLTPLYMAVIEPFRRFVVYPAILRRIQRAWVGTYTARTG